nr:hypothetical protein [Sedimentibacter sp.]
MKVNKIKKLLWRLWNTIVYYTTITILSLIPFIPEIILLVIWYYYCKNISIILPLVIIIMKSVLILKEKIITKRLNDYFIMYDIKWLNLYLIFQQVNKKEIKKKSCELKYEELKNMSENFDISLLKPQRNYITITHGTIIKGLKKIKGIEIQREIYLFSKNLDKLQFQIFFM